MIKKLSLIMALAAIMAVPVKAQWSQTYASDDANYNEGISLYQQGQYAAAQVYLQDYQQDFYYIACAFELRQKLAQKQLKEYLETHPYTTYASEVHYMLGVLAFERANDKSAAVGQKGYSSAIKEFNKADIHELFRPHQETIHFYRGYARLQLSQPSQAQSDFKAIMSGSTPYALQAKYYYAYCQYCLGDYGKALKTFLALEDSRYADIVPYYIVQIYYRQGQYDEVYKRANQLLANNPGNPQNGEVHRIMGEISYKQANYEAAITHLEEYENIFTKQGMDLLREDIYLMGICQYQLGNYTDAAGYLERVKYINCDTLTQSANLHLGHIYHSTGMTEKAKAAYKMAANECFTNMTAEEAAYNYALLVYESSTALEDPANVLLNFRKRFPKSEHTNRINTLLSDVYMQSKDYARALASLETIDNPSRELVLTKQYLRYQLATDAFLNNKHQTAVDWFDKVITNSTQPLLQGMPAAGVYLRESYFCKAESEYRLADYPAAKQALNLFFAQPTAEQSDNHQLARYLKGYILFQEKNYPAAQTAFADFVADADQSQATYVDALNRLGDCAFSQRDFLQAESYYARVQATGASGTDYATFQRGYTLGLLRRYADKIDQMERLVRAYPKSDYADDALYEIARAELQRENTPSAIQAYDRLLSSYPKSSLAPKATLEKAMLYYNSHDYDMAKVAYKEVIKNYPNSEEAQAALEGLETCYVETNNVNEYLAYVKTIHNGMQAVSAQDSLLFVAAEHQYMLGHFDKAVPSLNQYLNQYCDGGRYCMQSRYYLADSYYQMGKHDEAQNVFRQLTMLSGNPYMEEATMRVAEIAYDKQDYRTSLQYFTRLQDVASSTEKTNIARLGVLRSAYYLGDHQTTVSIASVLLKETGVDAETADEARYNRAKAYFALEQYQQALGDLTTIAKEVRTAHGAEAKYLMAQAYFYLGELETAEEEVMAFAGMTTSHQYWLARAFILLSDIYATRGDDFQAQQYLLSLQQNYRVEDDIQTLCLERLNEIDKRNTPSTTNEDEDDDE